MLRHLGYVAIALSIDVSTNRTSRLRNATPERLRELIQSNLQGLFRVLKFNAQNGIFLYRVSSQIIPFASHPVNRIPWWEEYSDLFDQMGDFIARHKMRVSMHPGHFTVLNSPDQKIVAAAIQELEWHVRFLESLHTEASAKIVVHVGGAYGDKCQAMDRFVEVIGSLSENVRRRLAIENDEHVFSVEDVLDVARRANLPVIFDWLHHRANSGGGKNVKHMLGQCFDTWDIEDGLPKVHFSSQSPNAIPGKHADWIDAGEFIDFLSIAPEMEFDCMLEAKCKDLALFRLRNELSKRGIVEVSAA